MKNSSMNNSSMDMGGMNNTDGMDNMDNMDGMSMAMNMAFYASSKATLLFKGASTDTAGEMVVGVFIVFLVSLLYEILRKYKNYFEEAHYSHTRRRRRAKSLSVELKQQRSDSPEKSGELAMVRHLSQDGIVGSNEQSHSPLHRIKYIALSVTLHCVALTTSYFIMLCVMTFNVWLFLAAIFGSGVGKLLTFTVLQGFVMDDSEHCNI